MTDQDDIINSILNEENTYDLNYNQSNYNLNDIMNFALLVHLILMIRIMVKSLDAL